MSWKSWNQKTWNFASTIFLIMHLVETLYTRVGKTIATKRIRLFVCSFIEYERRRSKEFIDTASLTFCNQCIRYNQRDNS